MVPTTCAWGYRLGEIPIKQPSGVKEDFEIRPNFSQTSRRPELVSLGPHIDGAAPLAADSHDPLTQIHGYLCRSAHVLPETDKKFMGEFYKHTRLKCVELLTPLAPDTDTSFTHWLEQAPYTQKQKESLLTAHQDRATEVTDLVNSVVKGFTKKETYMEPKPARGINSPSQVTKGEFGPIIHAVEQVVFKLPIFIKLTPEQERAQKIIDHLYKPGGTYVATDHSFFEAVFDQTHKEIERILLDYMTQYLPEHAEFMAFYDSVINTPREIHSLSGRLTLDARMSGEMDTSLGNGWTNFMLMDFLCTTNGAKYVGFVEGDDGIFRVDGPPPTEEQFSRLGFTIKLELHTELSEASFCGLISDPLVGVNVTDPIKALVKFGWADSQYCLASRRTRQALLRAKSCSLFCQFPGHPILQELALLGLRLSADCQDTQARRAVLRLRVGQYEKERLLLGLGHDLTPKEVSDRTRDLVYRKFGIPVDYQLKYELYLQRHEGGPLEMGVLTPFFPDTTRDYYETYVLGSGTLYHDPLQLPTNGAWTTPTLEEVDAHRAGRRT